MPFEDDSQDMCRSLRLTSCSLSCARVNFFFLRALNFMSSGFSSVSLCAGVPLVLVAADPVADVTALEPTPLPGRESSNRSMLMAKWPF